MKFSFHRLICFLILLDCVTELIAAEPQLNGNAPVPNEPLTLWYRQPASARAWTEALPIGNGRIGAMIFGGVNRERIQLNEDTLWGGGPYDPVNTNALATLRQ